MHRIPVALAILVATVGTGLGALRYQDALNSGRTWHSVVETARDSGGEGGSGDVFDPATIADLPEPVRRYFAFTLAEGTAIPPGVRIEMTGTVAPGPDAAPMTMEASQILALPHGFVWSAEAGSGLAHLSGSDALVNGVSWSRFWSFWLLPVGRAGGSEDHWRSAFGRMVAEAAFWSPASLLPRKGIDWTAPDAGAIRATVTHRGIAQSVDIFLSDDGAPVRVEIDRWSDTDGDGAFAIRRFGGTLADFETVDGITVPMRVEGGYGIGTPGYVPTYRAQVTALDWIETGDDHR